MFCFRKRAERIANGQKLDDKDLDAASKQTAQDFEDAANQELKQFVLPPRLTSNNCFRFTVIFIYFIYLFI